MEAFSALLAICAGNSPVPGEPVTRRFDVFFICVWINGWVNNRDAGDLRRYRTHYDVIVMGYQLTSPTKGQGAVSIRKTVLPGMAIPMLKIRRPNGRLIFNMEIAIRR